MKKYAQITTLFLTLVCLIGTNAQASIVTWTVVGEVGSANAPGILDMGETLNITFRFDSTKIPTPNVSAANGSRYVFRQGVDGTSLSVSDGTTTDFVRMGDQFTVQVRGEDNAFVRGELRFFGTSFGISDYERITVAFDSATTPFPDGNLVTSNVTAPTVRQRNSPGGSAALILFASSGSGTFFEPGTFTSTAVPEPNTIAALGAIGFTTTLWRRRQRRRSAKSPNR